jgi:hypothetical protein
MSFAVCRCLRNQKLVGAKPSKLVVEVGRVRPWIISPVLQEAARDHHQPAGLAFEPFTGSAKSGMTSCRCQGLRKYQCSCCGRSGADQKGCGICWAETRVPDRPSMADYLFAPILPSAKAEGSEAHEVVPR